jgi:hypothetical protein
MKTHLPEFYLQLCRPYKDLDQFLYSAWRLLDDVLLYQVCFSQSRWIFDGEPVKDISSPDIFLEAS